LTVRTESIKWTRRRKIYVTTDPRADLQKCRRQTSKTWR